MDRRGRRGIDRFPVSKVSIDRLWEITLHVHAELLKAREREAELRLARQTLVIELYQRGWTQTAIGERLGLRQSDVWKILYGKEGKRK